MSTPSIRHLHMLKVLLIQRVLVIMLLPVGSALAANCEMRLSDSIVDYGRLNRAELLDQQTVSGVMSLGKKNMTLHILCQRPGVSMLRYRAVAADQNLFQFTDKGKYSVRLSNAVVDGNTVELGLVQAQEQMPTTAAASVLLTPATAVVAMSGAQRAQGKSFSVQVEIEAHIAEESTRVREETILQASGVFELMPQ